MKNLTPEFIKEIIEVGLRAASADNLQPWFVRLKDFGFELIVDPQQLCKFFDVGGYGTQLALGAFIENVSQYALALGYMTHYKEINSLNYQKWDNNSSEHEFILLLSVEFQISPSLKLNWPQSNRQQIENRHTNRQFFQWRKKLPQNFNSEFLTLESKMEEGYEMVSYFERGCKWSIIHLVSRADTVRYINQQCHVEFGNVLRWNPDAKTSLDGLAEDTLALDFFTLLGLKFFIPWSRQKKMIRLGLHWIGVLRATWLLMASSSEVVALVNKRENKNPYENGRMMERFWIWANAQGLSVQPLGAMPLFFARLKKLNGFRFSEKEKNRITDCQIKLTQLTPNFDPTQDELVMMFRLGYAKSKVVFSKRKKLKDFLLNSEISKTQAQRLMER